MNQSDFNKLITYLTTRKIENNGYFYIKESKIAFSSGHEDPFQNDTLEELFKTLKLRLR